MSTIVIAAFAAIEIERKKVSSPPRPQNDVPPLLGTMMSAPEQ